jgi:hypothetical protein
MKLQFEPFYASSTSGNIDKENISYFNSKNENMDIANKLNQLSILRTSLDKNDNIDTDSFGAQDANLGSIYHSLNKNDKVKCNNYISIYF